MKKAITIIFILFTLNSFAQSIYPEYLSGKMITEMNAVIEGRRVENNDQLVFAKPPSFYNLELVVSDVKKIVDNNSDHAHIVLPWERKNEDPVFYSCIIMVDSQDLYIRYTPGINQLLFVYQLKEKD